MTDLWSYPPHEWGWHCRLHLCWTDVNKVKWELFSFFQHRKMGMTVLSKDWTETNSPLSQSSLVGKGVVLTGTVYFFCKSVFPANSVKEKGTFWSEKSLQGLSNYPFPRSTMGYFIADEDLTIYHCLSINTNSHMFRQLIFENYVPGIIWACSQFSLHLWMILYSHINMGKE